MAYVSRFVPSTAFHFMCQKVLPLVYDDSLSYYEVLCKMRDKINDDIEKYNSMGEAFNELVQYINNYFSDEQIQNVLTPIIRNIISTEIGTATQTSVGLAKFPADSGLSIRPDGSVYNNNPTPYTLPTASSTIKGGVAVGDGLHMDGVKLVNDNPTPYTLPVSTSSTLGGIKSSDTVRVAADGTASVPEASPTVSGVVKYTYPIYNNNGQLTVANVTSTNAGVMKPGEGLSVTTGGEVVVRQATENAIGGVKVGNGLNVSNDGTVNVRPASGSTIGGVKAGAGVSIATDGTISVTSGGVADSVEWDNVIAKPDSFPPVKASTTVIGGIKVGENLSISEDGTLSATMTQFVKEQTRIRLYFNRNDKIVSLTTNNNTVGNGTVDSQPISPSNPFVFNKHTYYEYKVNNQIVRYNFTPKDGGNDYQVYCESVDPVNGKITSFGELVQINSFNAKHSEGTAIYYFNIGSKYSKKSPIHPQCNYLQTTNKAISELNGWESTYVGGNDNFIYVSLPDEYNTITLANNYVSEHPMYWFLPYANEYIVTKNIIPIDFTPYLINGDNTIEAPFMSSMVTISGDVTYVFNFINNKINSNTSAIEQNTENINALESAVTENIQTLTNDVEQAGIDITNLQNTVNTHTQDITSLNNSKVNRTGDTMSGSLSVIGTIDTRDTNSPSYEYRTGSTRKVRTVYNATDDRFGVELYGKNNPSISEKYVLPATSDPSTDTQYNILTTKNSVTIAQGGTGATNAQAARENLGAVNKSGDTMTGLLSATQLRVYDSSTPYMQFSNDGNSVTGGVLENNSTRNVVLRQVGTNSQPEDYCLPVNSNPTSAQTYTLWTNKQLKFELSGTTLIITNN